MEGRNFFKTQYLLSWRYIKESGNFILFGVVLFLCASIVALYYQPQMLAEAIKKFIQEIIEKTAGLNSLEMILFIFNNNLKSSFFGMILGMFFGIFPIFTALANGYVLGFIAEKTIMTEGIQLLWRILPHGIFELPALFLSLGMGIRFGFFIFAENRKEEFLRMLESSLRVFLFVILPLLVVAAIIEGILISFLN